MNANESLFESIATEVLHDKEVEKSKMFGSPGLRVSGKVFAMMVKGKLVVKFPRARVEAIVFAGNGQLFDPGHGRPSKEWVVVQSGGENEWLSLVREAKDFVSSAR